MVSERRRAPEPDGGEAVAPPPAGVVVDIELTNRCNARCGFCPRDETPHQGLMAPEVLARALARAVELNDAPVPALRIREVSFCGLGDQLLNPDVARYVRATRDAGLEVAVNTNAALLDAERGARLLDAGVTRLFVNAGEIGADYEAVYGLPFERVHRNVRRFAAMAEDRCELYVVLVDHRRDDEHIHEVERFWREQGVVRFFRLDLLNRGGSLDLEGMDFERAPQHAEALDRLGATGSVHGCLGPFAFPFIGYDGRYYLCSSDWRKEAAVGDVFDASILEVVARKLELVRSRQLVCHGCNHDAVNRLTARLAERDAGLVGEDEVDQLAADLADQAAGIEAVAAQVAAHLAAHRARSGGRGDEARPRRLIPVSAR